MLFLVAELSSPDKTKPQPVVFFTPLPGSLDRSVMQERDRDMLTDRPRKRFRPGPSIIYSRKQAFSFKWFNHVHQKRSH